MKKIITSVFILICAVTNAQIMHDFTETFDSVFSHISRTDATTGVLYNRVLPFSNATSFNSLIVTDEQGSLYHQKFVIK